MSIEFVEPEEVATPVDGPLPADGHAAGALSRTSVLAGRVLGAVAAVAAILVGVAMLLPLYTVDRTAFVIDFDGTSTQDAHIPYDAFGHPDTVPLITGADAFFSTGGFAEGSGASGSTLTVSSSDGISYAPWWLGAAAALLVVAVWALVRPRSSRPAALVATLGGLLLGSAGAAWLSIRTVRDDSVPQIRYAADPALGLWLLVAAGGLALLAGLLRATRPPLRRLLPRRRPV